jgi:NAD(P)-dependent dehydrogenase (short-subunit alcohol dehydrogenase family)
MADSEPVQAAVITGGAGAIGRAVAEALLARSVACTLADRDTSDARLRTVEQRLSREASVPVVAVECEVRDRRSVEAMLSTAFAKLPGTDLLVNCAAVFPNTPFLEVGEEEWDEVVESTLKGTFLCSQGFARRLVDRKRGGRIVNFSSTASTVARPGVSHYAAAKAGVNQLTRVLAIELAPFGIAVNAVAPGLISTEKVAVAAEIDPAEHQAKLAHIPMARLGEPPEVAAMVDFLLSEKAAYMTGAVVYVDGGYDCGIPRY